MKLDNWLFSKQAFILLILSFLIYGLIPLFVYLTKEYLIKGYPATSFFLDIVISILAVFLLLFTIYKLGRLKYILSFNQLLSLTVVVSVYLSVRLSTDITYDKFSCPFLSGISYLDVIIFLISFFLIYGLIRSFKNWTKKYLIAKPESKNYFEDTPIVSDIKKTEQANQIVELINSSNFKGSFSIGIMGTWGHGKSSFINGIKEILISDVKSRDIISINFSPFLNHKEEDIISEFFTSFSSQLGRYSGGLSKSLMDYATSISKLYKRGEKVSFIDEYRFTNEKPAYELYLKINQQISDIGKKIVVYIDDLDRLSAREILEVFKLVRNTSNFNNTIFIIALDKTYVIKSLNEKSNSLEVKFIDKFFQLEVFLPEISEAELSDHLLKLLSDSNKIDEENIELIKISINKFETLFYRYIKNYRDCIRFANQIIFDHLVMTDLIKEIDTNDFLNLIFLKSRFPEVFSDLLQNREKYLVQSNRKFSLRKKDSKQEEPKVFKMLTKQKSFVDIELFEISEEIEGSKLVNSFTREERMLLLETLATMFGKDNPIDKSVMWEYNFYKVIKLRYSESDLRDNEFNELVSLDFKLMQAPLDSLLELGKGEQLLNRISFYTIDDKKNFENKIRLYFYLLKKSHIYSLNKVQIKQSLFFNLNEDSSNRHLGKDIELNSSEKKAIVHDFFTDEDIDLKERINLLREVEESERYTGCWGYDKTELKKLVISFLNEFFLKPDIWDINDYTFYSCFHFSKRVDGLNEVVKLTKKHLKSIDISVFCFQLLEEDSFTEHLYSVTLDIIKELFGSYIGFMEFIDLHPKNKENSLLEFRDFYELFLIADCKKRIKFLFSDNTPLSQKSRRDYSKADIERGERLVQVFLKLSEESKSIRPVFEKGDFSFTPVFDLKFNEKNYSLFIFNELKSKDGYMKYIFDAYTSSFAEEGINVSVSNNEKIIDKNGETLIQVYSIQK